MFRQRTDPTARAVQVELVDDVLVVSGPDLDAVLGEVGARLGPDAEVLDAQRSIVGGVGGFFGREQFTVQARVAPDESIAGTTPVATTDPAAAHDDDGAAASDERPVLNGASFAAALQEALREVDEQIATIEPAGPAAVAAELVPDEVHVGLGADAFDLLHDPAEAARTPRPATFPEVSAPAAAEALTAPPAPQAPAVAEPDVAPAAAAQVAPVAPVAPVAEGGWDQGSLLALSAPELSDTELRARLAELVGSPPVLPDRGIVAVVGEPTDAVRTAEMVAERGGLDPADVLVAAPEPVEGRPAWLTITTAADAGARRDRWSARAGLTVVAVALRPGLDGLQWTREVLAALRAEQVRLAVAGWRHVDEVLPRLSGLELVHTIDLCEPVDADAAAGFLGLPVPVATIAGRPATAQAWFDQLRHRVVGGSSSPAESSETPVEPRTAEPHMEGSRP